MNTAIQTQNLGKRYGRTWALRDCTLELPTGKVAALVGPNGAGKTTLLHVAVGLLRPDTGSVSVLGRAPADNRDLLSRVGFVAQDTPLYADFTAVELTTMGEKLNSRWDSALCRRRIEHARIPVDRPVGKLSGGQRAQVALALALAKRPELLLLDEPVASLDPLARREFLQTLMGAVADEGTTVLLSSHLLGDLERVCDYLILLQEGHVQLAGGVDGLLAQHKVLVTPRRDDTAITRLGAVIQQSHTEKQSTFLVLTNDPIEEPTWSVHGVTLEDLVLAYLANTGNGEVDSKAITTKVVRS